MIASFLLIAVLTLIWKPAVLLLIPWAIIGIPMMLEKIERNERRRGGW